MLKQVEIFTDGSCTGNLGGGYGAILRYRGREKPLAKATTLQLIIAWS